MSPEIVRQGYILEHNGREQFKVRHYPYRKRDGHKMKVLFFCEACKEAIDMVDADNQ